MALVSDVDELLEAARAGDRRSLSKLLTLVEDGHNSPLERGIGSSLGITGPPGVGKSSLIGKMIDIWVERGESVAVLAVDPSSPRTVSYTHLTLPTILLV